MTTLFLCSQSQQSQENEWISLVNSNDAQSVVRIFPQPLTFSEVFLRIFFFQNTAFCQNWYFQNIFLEKTFRGIFLEKIIIF